MEPGRPVERLMRAMGLQGACQGKSVRTTLPGKAVPCPLDHVNRNSHASRPNELWVSAFTYVSTWQGWLYVAFVIDVYARRIVGWRASSMSTEFVLNALAGTLRAQARCQRPDPPPRQGFAIPVHPLHRAAA